MQRCGRKQGHRRVGLPGEALAGNLYLKRFPSGFFGSIVFTACGLAEVAKLVLQTYHDRIRGTPEFTLVGPVKTFPESQGRDIIIEMPPVIPPRRIFDVGGNAYRKSQPQRSKYSMKKLSIILLVVVVTTGAVTAKEPAAALKEAGVKGGLIVRIGCGDGKFTSALHASDSYIVQGLATDSDAVMAARESLAGSGDVTIALFDGKTLPYADTWCSWWWLTAIQKSPPPRSCECFLRAAL